MSGHNKWASIKHKKGANDAKRGKIFQGEDFRKFTEAVRAGFSECKIFKPQSCRKASKEIYLIGKGKKTGGPHVRS